MDTVKDIIDNQDLIKSFQYETYLCPTFWESIDDLPPFDWEIVVFNKESLDKIPEKPGLYSFIISPRKNNHPQQYLGYIGKTDRTLKERFKEYLEEANSIKGRPKVLRLLNKWKGYIDFCYVEIEEEELISYESRLNDAFLPPFNSSFSATINKIKNAF